MNLKFQIIILKQLKFLIFLFIISSNYFEVSAQKDDIDSIVSNLKANIPELTNEVSFSANDISIQDFIRGIANITNLNIIIEPNINARITNNFSNVKVYDLLIFLCKQYNLVIKNIGNIIVISKYIEPPKTLPPRMSGIKYFLNDTISIDYTNEPITNVIRDIIDSTGYNIILPQSLNDIQISCYLKKMPLDLALKEMANSNGLDIKKNEDGYYLIKSRIIKSSRISESQNISYSEPATQNFQENIIGQNFDLSVKTKDSITINCIGCSLSEILQGLSEKIKFDYVFLNSIDAMITARFTDISLDELMKNLFVGTSFGYKKLNQLYLFGDKKNIELKDVKLITLKNRPVNKIIESIPKEYLKDIEINEYPELNSLIVSGNYLSISKIESFINQIDKVVPLIQIEILVIDIRKSITLSTGINIGRGTRPQSTQSIFPSIDYTLSTETINNLLNSFSSFGSVKVGKVTPDFYVNLKALESQGIIDVHSTPRLATINGHEASMSIGKTTYYKEEQSNIYGSLNTNISTFRTYKPVSADFSISIKPQVSEDNQITLEIEVKQSDFADKIEPTAPPGTTSRNFKSLIRVKNDEMVLLGGLEEVGKRDSGSGLPLLSRIPIIKWFFSSRSKETTKSKLSIFIKPTIIN